MYLAESPAFHAIVKKFYTTYVITPITDTLTGAVLWLNKGAKNPIEEENIRLQQELAVANLRLEQLSKK